MTVMQSMKLGIDVNRHKEIIVKSVSAILLLLLKHFKVKVVAQMWPTSLYRCNEFCDDSLKTVVVETWNVTLAESTESN